MFIGIERIQLLALIGSVLFLAGIIEMIRRKVIKEAYALLWLLFGGIFILFSCWKKGLDFFASLVGIYYPPALLFLILIVAIILILISYSVIISSQNDKIRILTQEIALLKAEMEKREKTDQGED